MGDGLFGVLVVLGLVVALGLFVAGFWVQKKRHERFRAWAVRNGWTYAQSERSLVDISRGPAVRAGEQPARHRGPARHVRLAAGALVHLPLDHRQREEPAARTTRTSSALALPTYLPTRRGDARGHRCPAGQAGGRAGRPVRVRGVQPGLPGGGDGPADRARDPAPAADGAAAAPRRARQRLAHRAAPGSCRGSPGPPTSTAWHPGSACSPPSCGPIPRHVWQDHGYDPLDDDRAADA